MADKSYSGFVKSVFSSEYGKLEKKRSAALLRPLQIQEINSLLSLRFNNTPIFESIEEFYSEEYKKALQENKSPSELEQIERFRKGTQREINLLYCDIHAREQKFEYTGGGAASD
jgi:hypothetical protein